MYINKNYALDVQKKNLPGLQSMGEFEGPQ